MNRERGSAMTLPERPTSSQTLTIDTESDPGAWATAIAHTPHLAAQLHATDEQDDRS